METNFLNNLLGTNIGDVFGSNFWSPIKTRNIPEPDDINAAIRSYNKRIQELTLMKDQGFETVSEYVKVKEAEATIQRHKRKSEIRTMPNEQE